MGTHTNLNLRKKPYKNIKKKVLYILKIQMQNNSYNWILLLALGAIMSAWTRNHIFCKNALSSFDMSDRCSMLRNNPFILIYVSVELWILIMLRVFYLYYCITWIDALFSFGWVHTSALILNFLYRGMKSTFIYFQVYDTSHNC